MFDASTFVVFATAVAILVFTPGPNTLYIIARSAEQGRAAGIVSALGVEVGTLIHVMFAALGISALLMSSALAFSVVKYAGAAYLIYLGIRTLVTRNKVVDTKTTGSISLRRTFSQAVIVNLLNPKSALFFLAFLPQFIDVERGSVTPQILLLGFIVVVIGLVSGLSYSLLAATAGNLFRRNLRFLKAQRYFAGSVYLGLGAATALTGANDR